jgi:L-asparagine transporter-like permease
MYWLVGILIMSSEVTALSIFSRYWFPDVKLWAFATIYALLGLGINLLGIQYFGKIEFLFRIVKTSSLAIFILVGFYISWASCTCYYKYHQGFIHLRAMATTWSYRYLVSHDFCSFFLCRHAC